MLLKRGLWTPHLIPLTGTGLRKLPSFHVPFIKHMLSFMLTFIKKGRMNQKAKTRMGPRTMKNYFQALSPNQETANLCQIGFQTWYRPVIPVYLPCSQPLSSAYPAIKYRAWGGSNNVSLQFIGLQVKRNCTQRSIPKELHLRGLIHASVSFRRQHSRFQANTGVLIGGWSEYILHMGQI